MALFGKKKEEKTKKEEEKPKIPPSVFRKPQLRTQVGPLRKIPVITTREFRKFKEVEKRPLSWYERIAQMAGKVVDLNPSEDMRKKLQSAIDFADLRITPNNVMSLFVMSMIVFGVLGGVSIGFFGIPALGGIGMIAMGALVGYYLYIYPMNLIKELRVRASSQVILAVLYMVVSMRISPNLERSLRFAAANISGALAIDMRKLIWDMDMRKFASAWEAIDSYIVKWKPENEEFAEALRLIRDSTTQTPERAKNILDEALNIVLEGTKTRMKHYAMELKTPVMAIHMMGIILPVLGTIMAPLAAVFMADAAKPEYFILGYDIALPAVLIWFINNTLRKRPSSFSAVGLEKHPDLPKKRHFIMGGKQYSAVLIGLIVGIGVAIPGVIFFAQNPDFLLSGLADRQVDMFSLMMSSMVIMGVAFGLGVYFFLSNFQKLKVQDSITAVESEFELALFQLGNRIAGGVPTEVAIETAIDDVKDLEISNLFKRTLNNIRNLGMTFEMAMFDKEYGAINYYPSKLIRNVMRAVVDTAKKGVTYASESMLRIAKYLKNIRETEEYMKELLEESSSSMKFQGYFLTPLITGLIVAMADIIIMVLARLGSYLDQLTAGAEEGLGMGNFAMIFGSTEATMAPELFQFIIGFYLIEILIILAIFLTKIGRGDDKTFQWYTAAKMLFIGVIFYLLVSTAAGMIFGDLIRGALEGLGME